MGKFILGFLCGVLGTLLFAGIVSEEEVSISGESENPLMFEESLGYIDCDEVQVFQTLNPPSCALAMAGSVVVMLINNEGTSYYDDMLVKGRRLNRVGLYRYTTKSGVEKAVPVVIMEKD